MILGSININVCAFIAGLFFTMSLSGEETKKVIVFFAFNKSDLDAVSMLKIDSALLNTKVKNVFIEGHCDSIDDNEYNDALSLRRASVVKTYLIEKGINESVIKTLGSGKHEPVNSNITASGRAYNRRAVITFWLADPRPNIELDTTLINTPVLNIDSVKVGSSIRLPNMNFVGGRHILLEQSVPTLKQLLEIMKKNPTLVIEIHGFVCCTTLPDGWDFDTRTQNLSVNRARVVYDYLVKNGIDKKRLSYRGYGSSKKLVRDDTEEHMSINRRVEIKIIEK